MSAPTTQQVDHPLLKELSQTSQEKAKLFYAVESLATLEPNVSLEIYLRSAFLILDGAQKSFIQDREESFLLWLIKQIASLQEGMQNQVYTLQHTVHYPFQSKEVLGIFLHFHDVNLNHLPDLTTFQNALAHILPDIHFVEGSLLSSVQSKKAQMNLYFEVQKAKGSFTLKECDLLKKGLLQMMQEDYSSSPLSMIVPDNRELLLKHFQSALRTLEEEDIPQVLIDFSRKVKGTLHFSGFACQVKKHKATSLKSRLQHSSIETEGVMTFEEKKLLKEGVIFSIQIPSSSSSSSVIHGRIQVASLIQSLVGSFRDLNGGLLEKAMETLHLLEKCIKAPQESIQRFFYSITPQEGQALTPIPLLKILYVSMKAQASLDEETSYLWEEIEEGICICLKTNHPEFEKAFKRLLYSYSSSAVFAAEHTSAASITGCILKVKGENRRKYLRSKIQNFHHECLKKETSKQVLRLSANTDFLSLDPRSGNNEETSYLHKMLFEGLMRIGKDGTPEPAIAKRVEKLDSGKRYRFFLRKSEWSNRSPLTAHDFVYSWKTTLFPGGFSPLNYLFYLIENGYAIKTGKLCADILGVQALDDLILEVRLTAPISHFLMLCCCSVFLPVCSKVDQKCPSWSYSCGKRYVCNGPFTLKNYHKEKGIVLQKNPLYWEEKKVHLEKILISSDSPQKSIKYFKMGKIDALPAPWCRHIPHSSFTKPSMKTIRGAPWMCYLSINCTIPPFRSRKIRQALSLALDRDALASFYSKEATPTYTLYSPAFSQTQGYRNENKLLALKLLIEGLEEEGMQLRDIQKKEIYVSEVNEPLATLILEQLKCALHLQWKACVSPPSALGFSHLQKKFTVKVYWWYNRVEDPSYFLESFSSKESTQNYTSWTDKRLQKIINMLQKETNIEKKNALHKKAENLLNWEQPFVPLFYVPTFSFLQDNVHSVYSSTSEHLDFRYSYKT